MTMISSKQDLRLMENGIINQSYKIIDPVTEVLNLPPDDEVEICRQ